MDPLFTLAGSGAWPVAQCHLPAPPNPSCVIEGRTTPEGTVYPLWLRGLEGQASTLNLGVLQADGTFRIPAVHPGRYLIQSLPLLPNPAMPRDGHVRDYAPPVIQSNRQAVDLGSSAEPIKLGAGGYFDPDGTRPVSPPVLAGPGSVHGTVENGASAAVVFLPEDYAQGLLGLLVYCQPDGTYDTRKLARGVYYAAAFRGLDLEGLRDPDILRKTVSADNKVRVTGDAPTELNLTAIPWPE